MKKSLDFLNQLIELEKVQDEHDKRKAFAKQDWGNAMGESHRLHQLKILKELIIEESK